MKDNLSVVPFRAAEKMPNELVQVLEHAVEQAKAGTLKSMVFCFTYDAGADAPIHEDGTPLLSGGHFFWRQDGNLALVHSDCHVLAAHALSDLVAQ